MFLEPLAFKYVYCQVLDVLDQLETGLGASLTENRQHHLSLKSCLILLNQRDWSQGLGRLPLSGLLLPPASYLSFLSTPCYAPTTLPHCLKSLTNLVLQACWHQAPHSSSSLLWAAMDSLAAQGSAIRHISVWYWVTFTSLSFCRFFHEAKKCFCLLEMETSVYRIYSAIFLIPSLHSASLHGLVAFWA